MQVTFSQKTGASTWVAVKVVKNTYDAFDRLVKQETDRTAEDLPAAPGTFDFDDARTEYF